MRWEEDAVDGADAVAMVTELRLHYPVQQLLELLVLSQTGLRRAAVEAGRLRGAF